MDQADNSEIIEGSTPTKTSTRKSRMQESLKNIKMARREISLDSCSCRSILQNIQMRISKPYTKAYILTHLNINGSIGVMYDFKLIRRSKLVQSAFLMLIAS